VAGVAAATVAGMRTDGVSWQRPTIERAPRLDPEEVHVWSARLDAHAGLASHLAQTLSPDERSRAAGFRLDRDRLRFTLRRGVLRLLLGRYLEVEPRRLRFVYGRYGMPALPAGRLRFNVSESDGLALFAISETAVGVDVERVADPPDLDDLARAALSPAEREGLRLRPPCERPRAFLTCWTRKEAYLKALGDGLIRAPAELDLRGVDGRWTIETFVPAEGFLGAVAARGHRLALRHYQWPPGPSGR
jgi:4'-phosphopantetheinyl transferase